MFLGFSTHKWFKDFSIKKQRYGLPAKKYPDGVTVQDRCVSSRLPLVYTRTQQQQKTMIDVFFPSGLKRAAIPILASRPGFVQETHPL